jgi:hypothetical protein
LDVVPQAATPTTSITRNNQRINIFPFFHSGCLLLLVCGEFRGLNPYTRLRP